MSEEEVTDEKTAEAESDDVEGARSVDGDGVISDGTSKGDDQEELPGFLDEVRNPISDEARAGESILYDETFRTLKSQVDAIGSASGEADYEQIVDLAQKILIDQSKDLRAAGYLILGKARLEGAEGLATGFHALRLLIEQYWDDLYPEYSRMRGRGNALQFVGDRVPEWLQDASLEPRDRQFLVSALEDLNELQEFCLGEMGEHAPALSGLKSDLEDAISDLPDREPDSEPKTKSEETREDTSSHSDNDNSPESEPSPSSPSEITCLSDATQNVRTAARFIRAEDLTSPLPYRLIRTIRWSELQSVPPNDDGATRFEPPRSQRRQYLEGLLQDGKYEALVREGEDSFQEGSFHVWLDLQRLVAEGLKALGDSHERAHRTVVEELALLLRQIPELKHLSFRDETPFASPLTIEWLETEVQSHFSPIEQDSSPSESAASGLDGLDEQYEKAREELRGGRLEAALSFIDVGSSTLPSTKEGFYRHYYAACLCVRGGEPRVALPLLNRLDAVIHAHELRKWDPSLAVDVWRTQCECYDRILDEVAGDEADRIQEDLRTAYDKICRTSPNVGADLSDKWAS